MTDFVDYLLDLKEYEKKITQDPSQKIEFRSIEVEKILGFLIMACFLFPWSAVGYEAPFEKETGLSTGKRPFSIIPIIQQIPTIKVLTNPNATLFKKGAVLGKMVCGGSAIGFYKLKNLSPKGSRVHTIFTVCMVGSMAGCAGCLVASKIPTL